MLWAFLACSVVWTVAVVRLGAWDEMHHFWTGVWLYAIGLPVAGLIFMADDAIQHAVQLWRPRARSPINLLYGLCFASAFQWLERKVAR